jgi:excisionase family DNA binding protein
MIAKSCMLTIEHACARYDIGRTQLYRLLNEGAITAIKFGRRTLINVASADAYFAALPVYTGELQSLAAAHDARRSREHPRHEALGPRKNQLRKAEWGAEQCHQDAI